jgi:hypothetical protein
VLRSARPTGGGTKIGTRSVMGILPHFVRRLDKARELWYTVGGGWGIDYGGVVNSAVTGEDLSRDKHRCRLGAASPTTRRYQLAQCRRGQVDGQANNSVL